MTVNIEGLGEITASEKVLCELINVFCQAFENYSRKNYNVSAERAFKACDAIFNELHKIGYFDDIKK